ncbi:phage DNA packaging protein J [Methylorubrum sp. B1-46]|uniref:phage DNA packaging protein J n=1 Tax=Methylorubrum sp. B1-46 TaxID=2897334 RepID=UPI00351D6E3B
MPAAATTVGSCRSGLRPSRPAPTRYTSGSRQTSSVMPRPTAPPSSTPCGFASTCRSLRWRRRRPPCSSSVPAAIAKDPSRSAACVRRSSWRW